MFTQFFTALLQHIASIPAVQCYLVVAVWVGLDSAGIPLPLEPVLLLAGALAAAGHISLVLAIASATAGVFTCAGGAYLLGSRLGESVVTRVFRRMGLTSAWAEHVAVWLEQRGAPAVFFAAVCPMLRTGSAYIMGVVGVPRRRFVAATLLAALSYISLWTLLGWLLGAAYRAPLRFLDEIGFVGFLILAVLVTAVTILHHFVGRFALRHVAFNFYRHQIAQAEAEAAATAYLDATLAAHGMLSMPVLRPRSVVSRAPVTPRPLMSAADDELGFPLDRLWTSLERAAADLWTEVTARSAPTRTSQVALGDGWPDWVSAAITFALSELALVLLMLAVAAHYFPTFPLDSGLAAQIQRLDGTFLAQPIRLAGDLQWYQPAAVSYVLIYGMLLALRRFRALVCAAVSVFGADLLSVVINAMVARPLPHGAPIVSLIGPLSQGSFPGVRVAHTLGLYGFVFFLCVLAMPTTPRWKPLLIAIQTVCVCFIVFVGLSRVMAGVSWPSDVLGGYLSGALVLALSIVLYHLLAMRVMRAKPAPVAQPALVAAG